MLACLEVYIRSMAAVRLGWVSCRLYTERCVNIFVRVDNDAGVQIPHRQR